MSEQPIYIETPLVYSAPMSSRLGRDVYLKMEALQPSGSFKVRGVELMMRNAIKAGAKKFLCSSGGNAGAAASYVAQVLKMPITVVIPKSTPSYMADLMRSYSATVVVEGAVWAEADTYARTLIADFESEHGKGSVCYVHPFDHDDIWTGHSTMVEEMVQQLPRAIGHRCSTRPQRALDDDEPVRPAAIVVSVGGGGLLSGVCEGLAQSEWTDVPVVAAETEGAASLAASIKANHPVRLPQITSLAVTLGASQVAQACLEWASQRIICPLVVSDTEAVTATAQFAVDHRVLVEPSCGAALAAAEVACNPNGNTDMVELEHRWARHVTIPNEGPIIIIVCGGNMASPALLGSYVDRVGAVDAAEALDVAPYHWRFINKHRNWITASIAFGAFALGALCGRVQGMSSAIRSLKA